MQVTKEGIERIKSANDLAAVVAERGIRLERKGRHLVASCPFHQEKTASFNVSSSKGLFHCFGCGVSGDVIGFVTKHDKVSFGGALETLARRAGLDLGTLMDDRPRTHQRTPIAALTPPRNGKTTAATKPSAEGAPPHGAPPTGGTARASSLGRRAALALPFAAVCLALLAHGAPARRRMGCGRAARAPNRFIGVRLPFSAL